MQGHVVTTQKGQCSALFPSIVLGERISNALLKGANVRRSIWNHELPNDSRGWMAGAIAVFILFLRKLGTIMITIHVFRVTFQMDNSVGCDTHRSDGLARLQLDVYGSAWVYMQKPVQPPSLC